MRNATLAGLALIVAGAIVLYRESSFSARRVVLNGDGVVMTADHQLPILPWIAGAALVAGVVLLVSGERRKA